MNLEWKTDTLGKNIAKLGPELQLWFWKISQKADDNRYVILMFCFMIYEEFASDEEAREFTIIKAREVLSEASLKLGSSS